MAINTVLTQLQSYSENVSGGWKITRQYIVWSLLGQADRNGDGDGDGERGESGDIVVSKPNSEVTK